MPNSRIPNPESKRPAVMGLIYFDVLLSRSVPRMIGRPRARRRPSSRSSRLGAFSPPAPCLRGCLECAAARRFLLRFGGPPLARINIGDHVVAERRISASGAEVDPFSRERQRFVEPLSLIQIQLGEIQMTLGELRIHFDCMAVGIRLRGAIASARIHFPEVEPRLVARLRVELDLLPVLGDRLLRMPALLGNEREVEVRQPDVRILCNRRADFTICGGDVAPLECDDAERVTRRDEFRLDRIACAALLARRRDRRDRAGSRARS